ncbi:MAG: hypothetical protein V2A61_06100 [Calditrichota bacterium]
MRKSYPLILCLLGAAFLFAGCATFRSEMKGEFRQPGPQNYGADKVSMLFIFSHYQQAKGYDAIPKLENKYHIISGFDDLFIDALNEISNVGRYSTFTEFASDVGDSKRRAEKDSLIGAHDFVIKMKFQKENSFAKHFLGILFSSASATLLPIAYGKDYTLKAEVFNHEGVLLKSYTRQASLSKWVQTLMIFVYPFHTEKRKTEEIYIGFMHDVFKQMETEGVLTGKE